MHARFAVENRIIALALATALIGGANLREACAATITVTSLADTGPGTLRSAISISESNADATNTIVFATGLTGTISLASTLAITNKGVAITGPGSDKVTVSGISAVRVFYIAGVHVTLSGLTVANGYSTYGGGVFSSSATLDIADTKFTGNGASSGGGAVFANGGTVTVTNATFTGNTAGTDAGALFLNSAAATIRTSTFASNTAAQAAGGVTAYGSNVTVTDSVFTANSAHWAGGFYAYGGTKTISGCTFSGNTSSDGGAILNDFGPASILNCTLTGNTANYGGAFSNGGNTTLINCTISGNTGVYGGGGMFNDYGTTSLSNTIVAGNAAPSGPDVLSAAPYTPITSLGYNLVGNGTAASGFIASDLLGTAAAPIDPKLGALADNGGPTRTMALLAGSPALDAGSNALAVDPGTGIPLSFDQRGFYRVFNSRADIGAFEVQPTTAFRVTSIARVGTDMQLAFPTILGKFYQLQRKDALTDTAWAVVIDNIAGTGASISVSDIGGGAGALTQRFYRVVRL